MNTHIIAIDLDGTLLRDNKTISTRNKHALQKVRELGHHVVIATGRPYRASHMYYKELNLQSPIVNFNGAYVHHPTKTDFETSHSPLQLEFAKKIIADCDNIGIKNIFAEVIDDVYLRFEDEKLKFISQFGDPKVILGDPLDTLQNHPTSILIDAKESEVDRIQEYLSKYHAEVVDHRRWAEPWHVIEILQTGISKAVGLKRICSYYGVSPSNLIAFGDEDNDKEMLSFAGYGIAMGNALDEIKELSNEVTLTNEEDGIAYYLERFFNF